MEMGRGMTYAAKAEFLGIEGIAVISFVNLQIGSSPHYDTRAILPCDPGGI